MLTAVRCIGGHERDVRRILVNEAASRWKYRARRPETLVDVVPEPVGPDLTAQLRGRPEGRPIAIAPSGADRLELRLDDGTRIPVELDATGAGTTTLSDSDAATVVAYAADGRVLGETPVPLRDRRYAPVPGESAATSIVLSAN